MDALKDTEVSTHSDYATKSRNYKLGLAQGSMQAAVLGNVVFDPSSQLPREVLLETTLKAFGFSMDLWEVCKTVGLIIRNALLFQIVALHLLKTLAAKDYIHRCFLVINTSICSAALI